MTFNVCKSYKLLSNYSGDQEWHKTCDQKWHISFDQEGNLHLREFYNDTHHICTEKWYYLCVNLPVVYLKFYLPVISFLIIVFQQKFAIMPQLVISYIDNHIQDN